MRIAYLISAYKDSIHLERLISALSYSVNDVHFFIHVDKKVNIAPFLQIAQRTNVHFTGRRFYVEWGGLSQVKYQVEMLRTALAYEKGHPSFNRFVIITGQDYPLMSNEAIIKEYQNNPNKIYMTGINLSK